MLTTISGASSIEDDPYALTTDERAAVMNGASPLPYDVIKQRKMRVTKILRQRSRLRRKRRK